MKKSFIAGDLLFIIQIFLAVFFGTAQFIHMLSSTTGLNTSTFMCTTIFLVINLNLSLSTNKIKSSRATIQTIWIYVVGLLLYGSLMVLMFLNSKDAWTKIDTITTSFVSSFILSSLYFAKIRNIDFADPLMKGIYGISLRVVPQISLAIKIFNEGGAGLSIVMIVVFHILTTMRIVQIFISAHSTQWDRNKKGLAIAEIGNELSWCIVTIAWLLN